MAMMVISEIPYSISAVIVCELLTYRHLNPSEEDNAHGGHIYSDI